MSTRKPIGKKVRFEVFKRDAFKCQYCGQCAPDVVLEVDHIHPVSKGGDNDILNYITSCRDCNAGKSDRLLSDDSAMAKQRAQLEELNERREQLEQMLAWREGLRDLDVLAVDAAAKAWKKVAKGSALNEKGRNDIKKLIGKFGLSVVLDAIERSERYMEPDPELGALYSMSSLNLAFSKLAGIARMAIQPDWKKDLYYIRGIARNRFTYLNEHECIRLLEEAYQSGVSIDDLRAATLTARNWSGWQSDVYALIGK